MPNIPNAGDSTFLEWRKSSRSHDTGDCVEIAAYGRAYLVRDSKRPGAGWLSVSAENWPALISRLKSGSYDL